MSSLQKFEGVFIDHTTKDLMRSYISNATRELQNIQKACGFGSSSVIVADRKLTKVTLVTEAFKLAICHGTDGYKTKITLHRGNVLVRNVKIGNLHGAQLMEELRSIK